MRRGGPAAVLLLAALSAVGARATEVFIGLEGGRGQRPQWVLGLPPFTAERPGRVEDLAVGHRIKTTVREDLLFSRYFKIVDPPSAEAAADPKGRAGEWTKAGAGFVLTARVADMAPKVAATAVVLDLGSKDALLERYYRTDLAAERAVAHRIADDVTRQLTGRPGIAHTRLVFANDATGNKELYVMDYDGEGLKRLTSHKALTLLPRWRPDGRRVVYTSYRFGNPDLFELDLEKGTTRTLSDAQGLNLAGGFSPDGTTLVATMSRQKNPNIYQVDLADLSVKPLTDHFGVDASPTYSPDGNQLAFVSDRAGNPQVHILDLATGRVRRLTRLNWCDAPSWSPSGEWIAFAGRANPKDRMDIFLVDVTGSQVRQLTHGEGSNEDPAWSPDGRFLAFTSTRDRRRRVYVMDFDGSAPHAVGDAPGNSFTPAWSP